MIRRRTAILVLLGFCFGLVAAGQSTASSAGHARPGLRLISKIAAGERTTDFTFETPALGVEPRVRVILPRGYNASTRRYPVLYLLHGAVGDYRSMVENGHVDDLVGNRQMILVMPDSGPSDGYSDWVTPADDGPRNWRTFHLDQMIPWVDRRYRTIARRDGRALAGISMGGGGAFKYAAHRPDMFVAATSLSGALDTNEPALQAVTGPRVYGTRAENEVLWRGDNPVDLASNLSSVKLALRTGNGLPGGPFGGGDAVEQVVHLLNLNMHARLDELHIAHLWDDYGPGGHTWPYWVRGLGETFDWTASVFADPPAPPSRFSYRTIDTHYSDFGWEVWIKRPAIEFSRLAVRHRGRASIFGSGRARICTPPGYTPGRVLRVTLDSEQGQTTRDRLVGKRGRLCVRVKLGPGNRSQQYLPEGAGQPTVVHRADLTLGNPAKRRR